MTLYGRFAKILLALTISALVFLCDLIDMERYRSGHNEAVLKTVCLHGHMGSNPILSVAVRIAKRSWQEEHRMSGLDEPYNMKFRPWRSTQAGRRGSPGKGVGREKRREGSNPSFSVLVTICDRGRRNLHLENEIVQPIEPERFQK